MAQPQVDKLGAKPTPQQEGSSTDDGSKIPTILQIHDPSNKSTTTRDSVTIRKIQNQSRLYSDWKPWPSWWFIVCTRPFTKNSSNPFILTLSSQLTMETNYRSLCKGSSSWIVVDKSGSFSLQWYWVISLFYLSWFFLFCDFLIYRLLVNLDYLLKYFSNCKKYIGEKT